MLKRFFPGDKKSGHSETKNSEASGSDAPSKKSALEPKPISLQNLKRLIPIRNLSDEELTAFSLKNLSEVYDAGAMLFNQGDHDDSVIYLLEGTATIQTEGGENYEIQAQSTQSSFPLCSGVRKITSAQALSPVHILRVSNKILRTQNVKPAVADIDTLKLPETLAKSRLFQAFCHYYQNDDLVLPAMPDIAVQLRNTIQQQNIGIAEASKIIQLDPTIASKLIQVANSPLYLPAKPIKNCLDAVNRLGLVATRNLVISISLKNLFKSQDALIKKRMKELWKRSIDLSAICFVLASKTRQINPDEALLAGLICDIGVIPFLHFAENFPRAYYQPEELDMAIPFIRHPVGSVVLSKWNFPEQLIEIPGLCENWYYTNHDDTDLSLSDIVILSRWHSYIRTPKIANLPPVNSLPAYSKLDDGALSPEYSLKILHDAHDQIAMTLHLFGGEHHDHLA